MDGVPRPPARSWTATCVVARCVLQAALGRSAPQAVGIEPAPVAGLSNELAEARRRAQGERLLAGLIDALATGRPTPLCRRGWARWARK
jgi:hypothetical protein